MPQNIYHAQMDDTKDEGWVLRQQGTKGAAIEVCVAAKFTKEQALAVAAELNRGVCIGWKAAFKTIACYAFNKAKEPCPKTIKTQQEKQDS